MYISPIKVFRVATRRQEKEVVPSSKSSGPSLDLIQPPVRWVLGLGGGGVLSVDYTAVA
jgi:hypothetical protein